MVAARSFLAMDLGAESGRTILGTLMEAKLEIRELGRFENGMMPVPGHWHWNIFRLFEEMKQGLKAAAAEGRPELQSLALDTWGVDFARACRLLFLSCKSAGPVGSGRWGCTAYCISFQHVRTLFTCPES